MIHETSYVNDEKSHSVNYFLTVKDYKYFINMETKKKDKIQVFFYRGTYQFYLKLYLTNQFF